MSSRSHEGGGRREGGGVTHSRRPFQSRRIDYLVAGAALVIGVGGVGAWGLAGVQRAASRRPPAASRVLRVCADPNNLPFSNAAGQGFENHIAALVGRELHEPVTYTWWAQRRGFVRNTLKAKSCDVWMGAASGMDMMATTEPYYRSSYVFISRRDRHLDIHSFDDPRLRTLRVGVQLIGDDFANTPPVHALSRRGIVRNVVGYTVYGDYSKPNPPARIIDAVAKGDVDVAVAWGPLAGYFASREPVSLDVVPVSPAREGVLPFVFDISMGVRKADTALRAQLDRIIDRDRPAIDSILASYGVPLVRQSGRQP